jgi:ubiquinone/menaquinone biosynthesis C-methylase UbiE
MGGVAGAQLNLGARLAWAAQLHLYMYFDSCTNEFSQSPGMSPLWDTCTRYVILSSLFVRTATTLFTVFARKRGSTRGLSRARSAQAVCERWQGRIHHPRHWMLFPIVAIVAVAFVIFFFLVENLSIADIYDIVIVRMTRVWYAAVLDRLEPNSRLLDVGIGTATALVSGKNKSVIIDKQLKIIGIDYEAAYVKKASFVCQQAGLSQQVKVYCQSIYDDKLHGLFSTERERFDAAYFSGSITLMPDPAEALKCAARMLKPGGVIYVTQTFQNRPSPFMEWLKPRLHKLTTIDFGRVTYHTEVAQIVRKAGMVIAEDAPVPGSINNANQTARMLVVKQIFSGSVLNPYNSQDMRSV